MADCEPGFAPDAEAIIAAFETAWRAGERPAIADFVTPCKSGPANSHALLWELIAVDLEFRWRTGKERGRRPASRGPLLEWYRKRLHELGPLDTWPDSLVAEEYRVRSRWGDAPSHAEYLARLPRRELGLSEMLTDIDVVLADEGLKTGEVVQRRRSPSNARRMDPDAPLEIHDFALKRQIGVGGMCKVYTAVQLSLDKPVAIKVLRKERLSDALSVQRFRREARLVASLRHPGIVDVHGIGRLRDSGYFMVLDLVAGQDLSRWTSIEPFRAAQIVLSLAETLAYVHRSGMIHADLKPANVLLDLQDRPHLTDFGLAQRFGVDVRPTLFDEHPAGTAAYMAPEQFDADAGIVGPWTDVYGLGGILFSLLFGRAPRLGSLAEIMAQLSEPQEIAFEGGKHLDKFEPLAEVCRRALRRSIGARFDSMAAFADALRLGMQNFHAPGTVGQT